MKGFSVLLTCCGNHISERIRNLKENEDGVDVKVYACNCNDKNLPYGCGAEDYFLVPPISSLEYIDCILDICNEYSIDVIIPTVTLELEFMAEHKDFFEAHGIKVSISSSESLKISNNKLHLYEKYQSLMPSTMATTEFSDLLSFHSDLGCDKKLCVKLQDHCGGNGFAIIDDEKARDMTFFNRRNENRYVSFDEMEHVMKNLDKPILVQEYIEGYDYSVSVLADHGNVIHICGYYGYAMSFGAIEQGEIKMNRSAYDIAELICNDLGLDGNACFDFRITPDGKVYLLEVNPRVNASLPFVTEAGINMLYLRCKRLLGDYSDNSSPIKYGLKMRKYHESRYIL